MDHVATIGDLVVMGGVMLGAVVGAAAAGWGMARGALARRDEALAALQAQMDEQRDATRGLRRFVLLDVVGMMRGGGVAMERRAAK